MRIGLRVAQVIDGDDLDVVLLAALVVRTQDVAADAAIAVDGDFDGHCPDPCFEVECVSVDFSCACPWRRA
jgi:hypothetical protein